MTRLLSLLALVALTGCAVTVDGVKHTAASRWEGKPVSVALAKLGTPMYTRLVGRKTEIVPEPETVCPLKEYPPFGSIRDHKCLEARKLVERVIDPGTGETAYTWRNSREHGGGAYTPLVTSQYDGMVGNAPVYGSITTPGQTVFFDSYTGYCAFTITADPNGIIKSAEVHSDDPAACKSIT